MEAFFSPSRLGEAVTYRVRRPLPQPLSHHFPIRPDTAKMEEEYCIQV